MSRSFLSFRWLFCAALVAVLSGAALLVERGQWDHRLLFWLQQDAPSTGERARSIWLPDYRVVIEALPLAGLESDEASGLAYSRASGTLFTVTGKVPQLIELSTAGEVLRRVGLGGFGNPEAVEVLDDGRIAIVDERARTLSVFHLPEQVTRIEASQLEQIDLGFPDAGNKGFEGLAWDARHSRLLLAKERDPTGLFSLPFPDADGATGVLSPLPTGQLFVRDMSSLAVNARTGHILLLSEESRLLLELDEQGEPVSFISLLGGFHGLERSIEQAEGVAIDDEGTLYLVGEPNLFYVFRRES